MFSIKDIDRFKLTWIENLSKKQPNCKLSDLPDDCLKFKDIHDTIIKGLKQTTLKEDKGTLSLSLVPGIFVKYVQYKGSDEPLDEAYITRFISEVITLKRLDGNKGIATYRGWFYYENYIILAMDRIEGITLHEFTRTDRPFFEKEKLKAFILQVFKILYDLYTSYNFTHYDLHFANIIVKNYKSTDTLTGDDVLIIDYESGSFSYKNWIYDVYRVLDIIYSICINDKDLMYYYRKDYRPNIEIARYIIKDVEDYNFCCKICHWHMHGIDMDCPYLSADNFLQFIDFFEKEF